MKINNMFTTLPPSGGVILACEIVGDISKGDIIIISNSIEVVISEIEKNPLYKEVNIIIDEEDSNGFEFSYSLIGHKFLIK